MRIVWKQQLNFFSRLDQAAFESWLDGIDGVGTVKGLGHLVEFDVVPEQIADRSLRELIAIYQRYGGDLAELAPFENDANRSWLRDANAAWFDGMFGDAPA